MPVSDARLARVGVASPLAQIGEQAAQRLHARYLTASGDGLRREVVVIARQHEQDITDVLTRDQREALTELLTTIADSLGLRPGVHPGFRDLGRRWAGVTNVEATA